MKLDREISKKALTDGFCLLYGEEYRNLFDTVGEKIIELGIKNGRDYFTKLAHHEINCVGMYIMVDTFEPSERYKNIDEFKNPIIKDLKPFFSKKITEDLFIETPYISFNRSNFAWPVNNGVFNEISNVLEKVKPRPIKKILSFDYFKQFPTYDTHQKTVNLYTEGGFSLDQFDYKSVKYYLEENEDFYLAEAIPYKYHQLGSTLIREQLKTELVESIKKNVTKDTTYWAKRILAEFLSAYYFCSERDATLLEIQEVCGNDGFLTPKQVHNRLSKIKFIN